MKTDSTDPMEDSNDEIAALVAQLHETQQRLQKLTGGQVDAVVHPAGQYYLLHEAQEGLRHSEVVQRQLAETQVSILNALPAHIALLDPQGVILATNEAWQRFATGNRLQGPEFFKGQNYLEICDAATGPCSEEARPTAAGIRRVLKGEAKDFVLEYPCHSPTEKRWFRLMVTPVGEGSPIGAVVMHIDVTERKIAEMTLRASESRLQKSSDTLAKVLDSSLDAICAFDAEGRFTQVSAACERIWGYLPDELLGTAYIDKVFADDQAMTREAALQIMGGVSVTEFENRYVHKNGSITHISWSAGWSKDDQTMFCAARDVTAIRHAHSALEESRLRHQALFENMLEGYAYCRLLYKDGKAIDFVYLEVNAAFEEQSGLKDVIGKKVSELIPGILQTNPDIFELYARVAQTGEPEKSEKHIESLGLWMSVSVYSHEKEHFSAVFDNITERKRAEESLNLFRSLIDESPDAIEVIDPETGRFFDVNHTVCQRLGYTREEMLSMTVSQIVDDHAQPFSWPAAVKGIRKTGSSTVESRHRRKDGSTFPIEVNSRYIKLKRGYVVSVIRDITERKQIEGRYRLLIDSNLQAVLFWNRKGKITGGNDAFLHLIGYTREDLQAGRIDWVTLTPPEYVHLDARSLEEIDAKGFSTPYEKEFFLKDGTRVPILLGAAAFEDNREEGVAFALDLTERKKFEQQFFRAQRMDSIGTLAGGIAHDVNNILAPIMMSIHLLKDTNNDPQAQEILETIEMSARRGADIVRQVLSFARGVEGERVEIQLTPILKDLETIVRDTFPKNIRMKCSVPANTWTFSGDSTQVHQILLNLCVNARDAMPNGGTLTIEVKNSVIDEHYAAMNLQSKPGRYICLGVTDTGTGMPRDLIDKIFEPFFTTKEIGQGTGLGLSTVTAIVKGHAGFVNVYSEPGKGTTFQVYLPAMVKGSDVQKKPTQSVELKRGKGETILVIDDELSILTITSKALTLLGYKVLTATDGADAIAVYSEHKNEIALVLTDMTMPIMDGPAAIRALTRINPKIKIIAASGLKANADLNNAAGENVRHFLTKPYTAGTLSKAIQAVLKED